MHLPPRFKRNFSLGNTCFSSTSFDGLITSCKDFPTLTFPASSSLTGKSRFSLYLRSAGLDTIPACFGIQLTVKQYNIFPNKERKNKTSLHDYSSPNQTLRKSVTIIAVLCGFKVLIGVALISSDTEYICIAERRGQMTNWHKMFHKQSVGIINRMYVLHLSSTTLLIISLDKKLEENTCFLSFFE